MSGDSDGKMSRFALNTPAVIKGLFAPRLFFGLLGLLLLVGCTSSTPQTQQQPVTPTSEAQLTPKENDRTMSSLDVQLIPEEAGIILLNPSPVDERYYVTGITVTIDVIPQLGWVVAEWIGPVFEIFGDTAYVTMDGNKSVVVRLEHTPSSESPSPTKDPFGSQMGVTLKEPTAVPTATAVPTPTTVPTPTPGPYYRAGEYRLGEHWSQAIREYSTVIEADPDDGDAYFFRAYSYHQIGSYWPAISDYDKALELSPSPEAYNNRGDAYRDMGRYDQAIDDYTEAIKSDPDYAQAYNSRAMAEKSLGKDPGWSANQACSLDSKYCPTPTPIPTFTPTIAPTPKLHGMQLSVNGTVLNPSQSVLDILNGQVVFNPGPGASGKYDQGTSITVTAYPAVAGSTVILGGVNPLSGNTGTIFATGQLWSMSASITLPLVVVPTPVLTATAVPTPTPIPTTLPALTPPQQQTQGVTGSSTASATATPNPTATSTPTPTCGGAIYGVGNNPTGEFRKITPQGDPTGFSQGCYGRVSISTTVCNYNEPYPFSGDHGPECHSEERYEYLAAKAGDTEYSIIDYSRIPPDRGCRDDWQYVPGGIYSPCN